MPLTISEELFEQFCRAHSIQVIRIDESSDKTPDYEISTPISHIIVEVKELTLNEEDLESERLLTERGYGSVVSSVPGDRIRNKINSASPQIKARTHGQLPGLLVIYAEGRLSPHLEPYCVKAGMFGLQQIIIAVPQDYSKSPYAIGSKLGPKKKMTQDCNTSISAIATMYHKFDGSITFSVFHNHFAKIPIQPSAFPDNVDQFLLSEADNGHTPDWVKCSPPSTP